jgi:hypothetical protein
MFSFNDIGGEDGGDFFCNIFDFDEDDDVVGRMQSEWDEDTSTTTKKRKFKAFLTDGDIPYISQTSSRPFLVVPGKTAAAF